MRRDAAGRRAARRGPAGAAAARAGLPFGVWMALAKATPLASVDEDAQGLLDAN